MKKSSSQQADKAHTFSQLKIDNPNEMKEGSEITIHDTESVTSAKKFRKQPLEEKKLLLASRYVTELLSVLGRLLATKNIDSQ